MQGLEVVVKDETIDDDATVAADTMQDLNKTGCLYCLT